MCGPHYNCCSPYWKMCIEDNDCCEKHHVCRSADGFDYDRCLWRSAASKPSPCLPPLMLVTSLVVLVLTQGFMTSPSTLFSDFTSGFCKFNSKMAVLISLSVLVFICVNCGSVDTSQDGAAG